MLVPGGGTAEAAEEGARRTAAMSTAAAGRSAHMPAEHLRDVVDPGAAAVARMFRAAASVPEGGR